MRKDIIVLAVLLIILATIIIIQVIPVRESQVISIADISNIMAAIIAAFGLFFVGCQIYLQREDFSLDKRPYLYVYLKPEFNIAQPGGALHGGGHLVFNNSGKIPASDINLIFTVGSDQLKKIDLRGWFIKNYGDFPEVKTVFPNHKNASVYIHPRIGNDAKLFYLGVLFNYSSTDSKRLYWYKFRQLYSVQLENGEPKTSVIYTYTDWDRNRLMCKEDTLPDLEHCDWQKHLTCKTFVD